ncbi:hypothetical protein BT96DRAFT_941135 [Gymnopus androsaceus JB14]|uniref:Uncharacterized protein n=1 Tax=Gymnopus androsaceus JB14 TaxID=1447944 RepID=A0A6A4HFB9_9AGAR|nr:hypothetical protein BT96DRAFT_941135 [Gymnopus androsaceus JB14]
MQRALEYVLIGKQHFLGSQESLLVPKVCTNWLYQLKIAKICITMHNNDTFASLTKIPVRIVFPKATYTSLRLQLNGRTPSMWSSYSLPGIIPKSESTLADRAQDLLLNTSCLWILGNMDVDGSVTTLQYVGIGGPEAENYNPAFIFGHYNAIYEKYAHYAH